MYEDDATLCNKENGHILDSCLDLNTRHAIGTIAILKLSVNHDDNLKG